VLIDDAGYRVPVPTSSTLALSHSYEHDNGGAQLVADQAAKRGFHNGDVNVMPSAASQSASRFRDVIGVTPWFISASLLCRLQTLINWRFRVHLTARRFKSYESSWCKVTRRSTQRTPRSPYLGIVKMCHCATVHWSVLSPPIRGLQRPKENKAAFQSKAEPSRTGYTDTLLCCCDLDLDPMTSIYELDLNIPKMYLHTKNGLYMSRLLNVRKWDRQTDIQLDRMHTQRETGATENITTLHSWVVKSNYCLDNALQHITQ